MRGVEGMRFYSLIWHYASTRICRVPSIWASDPNFMPSKRDCYWREGALPCTVGNLGIVCNAEVCFPTRILRISRFPVPVTRKRLADSWRSKPSEWNCWSRWIIVNLSLQSVTPAWQEPTSWSAPQRLIFLGKVCECEWSITLIRINVATLATSCNFRKEYWAVRSLRATAAACRNQRSYVVFGIWSSKRRCTWPCKTVSRRKVALRNAHSFSESLIWPYSLMSHSNP